VLIQNTINIQLIHISSIALVKRNEYFIKYHIYIIH